MTKRMLNIEDSADCADCAGFCRQSALLDVVSLYRLPETNVQCSIKEL